MNWITITLLISDLLRMVVVLTTNRSGPWGQPSGKKGALCRPRPRRRPVLLNPLFDEAEQMGRLAAEMVSQLA
jgi:hypothetical protein